MSDCQWCSSSWWSSQSRRTRQRPAQKESAASAPPAPPKTSPNVSRNASPEHTSNGFIPAPILRFARVYRLLDKGIAVGQCPEREVFPQKTLKNPAQCGVLRYAFSKSRKPRLTTQTLTHARLR